MRKLKLQKLRNVCMYTKKNTNNNMCALFFNGIIVNLYFWSWEKIDALNGRLDLEWVQELLLQFGPSIFFSYHVKNPGIFRSRDCVCLVSLILQLYIYCPRQLKSVGYICILLLLYLSAQHEYWKSQKKSRWLCKVEKI